MYSQPTLHRVNGQDFKAHWQRRIPEATYYYREFWEDYEQISDEDFDAAIRMIWIPVLLAALLLGLINLVAWLT